MEYVDATCPPAPLDSEHPLFILYTSGSTGKPKGILHTTGGYLTGVHSTMKYVFDLREDDTFWCIIEEYEITILYTAPTAIRSFIKWGDQWPNKHDLSSLRLLGSVGEPINPEAWMWYHTVIDGGRCPIVDTWWQTETGAILISPIPGATPTKPGTATLPFFGIDAAIVDNDGNEVPPNTGGKLVIRKPWPSMMRATAERAASPGQDGGSASKSIAPPPRLFPAMRGRGVGCLRRNRTRACASISQAIAASHPPQSEFPLDSFPFLYATSRGARSNPIFMRYSCCETLCGPSSRRCHAGLDRSLAEAVAQAARAV